MEGSPILQVKNHSKLAALSIILLSVFLLTACEAEKTDEEYLASAKKYAAEGNMQSYEIELKNTLQQNPENAEARYLLGLRYLKAQLGAAAEKELSLAVELGIPEDKTTIPLIRAMYYQYRYDDVLKVDLDHLLGEETATGLLYKGISQLNLGKAKEAEAIFESAANTAPNSISGMLAKAYLYALFENYDDALAIISEINSKNPEITEAYILQSKAFLALRNIEPAIQSVNKAIELEPNRLDLYINASRVYLVNKQLDEAEKNINTVLKAAPKHLFSNLIKARIRLQIRDFESAREHAEKALTLSEVNKEAKLISGIANFYLKNWTVASDRLRSVKSFIKPDHMAHRMLSYAEFKLGYSNSAETIVESIGTLKQGDEALLSSYGSELARKGEIDEAVSLFETAAGLNPDNADVLTRLGILKLQQNDVSGLADLEKALEQDKGSFWARAALARNYLQSGNSDAAVKTANDLIALEPDNLEGYILLAEVQKETGNLLKAKQTLTLALEKTETRAPIYRKLVDLAALEKNFDQVNTYNDKVLSLLPTDGKALGIYYQLAKQRGEQQQAIDRVSKIVSENSENDGLKLVLARLHMDNRNIEKATALLNNIKSDSPQYSNAQIGMARMFAKIGRTEEAIPYAKNWVSASPKSQTAYQFLAGLYQNLGQNRNALTTVQNGISELPGSETLKFNEIQLLLQTGREQQALSKIARHESEYGSDPRLEALQGRHYARKSDFQRALKHFLRLHEITPSTRSIIGIAELHNQLGNTVKAKEVIRDWLAENPDDQPARLFLANIGLNTNQNEAIQQYEQLIETNNQNFIALNNLAWLLGEQGKLTQAIDYASQANKLRPNTPQILDTLGYLLLRAGEVDNAVELLNTAHELKPEEPTIAFHYAMALKEKGNNQKAKNLLLAIVEQDFPGKTDARALLKKL